ncbi:Cytochrome c oxidase subunit 5A [Trichinella pseudospiralis]
MHFRSFLLILTFLVYGIVMIRLPVTDCVKQISSVLSRTQLFSSWRKFSSHTAEETPEQFDKRFIDFFNQPDIDGWLVRKGLYELHCHDVVPEPTVAAAALRACRRVNDYALAVRFLEAIKLKCGRHASKIYPYIIQELRPVLNELGISTPEEMQFDKPQLFKPSPDWWPEEYYEIYKFPKHSTYPMKYV